MTPLCIPHHTCDEEYIEKSSRTFGERFIGNLKAPSLIYGHQNNSSHKTSVESFKIIGREGNNMARASKKPYTLE